MRLSESAPGADAVEAKRFRINGPGVLHETVEEETIIVNLDTGTYYDLNPTGAFLLDLIERGASVEEMALALASRYEVDPSAAVHDVQALVDRLAGEEIIVANSSHVNGDRPAYAPQPAAASNGPATLHPYCEPALSTYTDMQDLLLLDPVHEVDETGWPRRA